MLKLLGASPGMAMVPVFTSLMPLARSITVTCEFRVEFGHEPMSKPPSVTTLPAVGTIRMVGTPEPLSPKATAFRPL